MRLQSLNCPNCGSPLRTENDVQICDSCGSTFRIDYDDSDVAYERLSKEDEIARQKFRHEKEMLETQYRLQEEARLKQAKYEKSEARKKRIAGKITALITLAVMATVFFGFVYIMYVYIKGKDLGEALGIPESTTATETTVSPYLISASDLLADSEFIDNAIASVLSEVRTSRGNETVTTFDIPYKEWKMIGEPEIYDCYFLTSEEENRLCFLVKITYQSQSDDEDTQEVYDCLYLRNLKTGNNGKISSDYAVRDDRGEGATDWIWAAALDRDQLYRSAILGKSDFDREKVALPAVELPSEETEEDSEDEYDEYEDEFDEDGEDYDSEEY